MKFGSIEIRGEMTRIHNVNDKRKITNQVNGDESCCVYLITFILNSRLCK